MARRKQLKGIAENLAQWVISRNFDSHGYWALGQFYKFVESKDSKIVVLDLKNNSIIDPVTESREFETAIEMLTDILAKDIRSNKIPESWLKEVKVMLHFESEYKDELHYWGSKLGGKPFTCTVSITTDLSTKFTKEIGCNVWVHNPKRESRR
jgi:hypothetical protein